MRWAQARLLSGLLVALGLVGAGCAKDVAKEPPQDTTVKLLDAGVEPRRELRYRPKEGTSETLVMDMTMSMSMGAEDGNAPAVKLPTMRMTMPIEIREVVADGNIRFDYELTEAAALPSDGAPEAMVKALDQELQKIIGMKGSALISPRGETLESELTLPDTTPAAMRQQMQSMQQSMSQMAAPLPVEAVGKGARWQVTMPINSNGMKMTQTATYTLKDFDDESLRFDVTLTQDAPEQQIRPPGASEANVTLKELKSKGTGSGTFYLTRIVPDSKVQMKTRMRLTQGEQETQMSMGLDIAIHPPAP